MRGRLISGGTLAALGLVMTLLPSVLALDESWGLATFFSMREVPAPPSDVVVVGIDRDAAASLGETSELDTWSRSLHASVVERLAAAGASAVAFDLVFDDARDRAGDEAFAAALSRAGNVVLAERTQADTIALAGGSAARVEQRFAPLASLESAALATAPFVLPRVPVRVGQFWTFGPVAADAPSLPVVVLQIHSLPHYETFRRLVETALPGATAAWPTSRAEVVTVGLVPTMRTLRATFAREPGLAAAARARVELESSSAIEAAALRSLIDLYAGPSSRYLNFYGPARTVTTLPYDEVLAGDHGAEIAGKAVFVGLTERRESDQQDDFYSVFSEPSGRNLSGVEIGATAFANLLEGRTVVPLAMPAHVALVAAFGLLVGALAIGASTGRAAILCGGLAAGYFAVAAWQFSSHALWLPLVVPLLVQLPGGFGIAVWRNYRALAVQRQRVSTALGYYVPASLARRLAEQTVSLGAAGELLHGTCLYSDAERYTTVAESLPPAELAALMNDYYRELFGVVERYGGQISDTAGDSMVAVWASARPDPAVRENALAAAVAMARAVEAFNARQPQWRLPTRFGLESGELLIGNIGAEQRYEYRAIGDIVNTAARIQDLNRDLGTRVLVSAASLEGATAVRTRPVGSFLLRGKRLPVEVHELEPVLDDDALAEFGAALAVFRGGGFEEAEKRFGAFAARHPKDGPARFFHALASRYRDAPPESWAGAVPVTALS